MLAERAANWLASLFHVYVLLCLPRPSVYCSALLRATFSCHWQSWIYIKVTNCSEEARNGGKGDCIIDEQWSCSGSVQLARELVTREGREILTEWLTCRGYRWNTSCVPSRSLMTDWLSGCLAVLRGAVTGCLPYSAAGPHYCHSYWASFMLLLTKWLIHRLVNWPTDPPADWRKSLWISS
jgi:hypothetical protein